MNTERAPARDARDRMATDRMPVVARTTYTLGDEPCEVIFYDHNVSAYSAIETLNETLHVPSRRSLIVGDVNIRQSLNLPSSWPTYFLSATEHDKQWRTVASIAQRAIDDQLERGDLFIAIGGGALCDIVGFAASIYLRGIGHHFMPSTLLAMVDASFGGKTGINFGGYKNMLGTFRAAQKIMIVPSLLATLPDAEFKNGLAEVIKAAMLDSRPLYALLDENYHQLCEERDMGLITTIIQLSLDVKAHFVGEDYRESGRRAYLNLGHTFAHALESIHALGGIAHGEAVAWGLAQALRLGAALGITDREYARHTTLLIKRYGYRLTIPNINWQDILSAMRHDKKVTHKTLRFVLQSALCDTDIVEVDAEQFLRIVTDNATLLH